MARPTKRRLKREVREVVEWAEPLGWELLEETDSNDHWVLRYQPTGDCVHLPCTPSNRRSLENSKAKIRRLTGISSDSGPAARYRHESRGRPRFDMRAAAREARGREEERERLAAEHAAWQAEVDAVQNELNHALDELLAINPRRHPFKVRQIAQMVVALEERLEELKTTE